MQGHRLGYVRVSSFEENAEHRLEGIPVARTFTGRLPPKTPSAQNLDDLRHLVQTFTGRGVRVEFVKEGLVSVVRTPRWLPRYSR